MRAAVFCASALSVGCGARVGVEEPEVIELRERPVALIFLANHDNVAHSPHPGTFPFANGRDAQHHLLTILLPPLDQTVQLGVGVDRDNVTAFIPNCSGEVPLLVRPVLRNAARVRAALMDAPPGNGATTPEAALAAAFAELDQPAYQGAVRGIVMFMAIELNSCYRPGAPLQQRIASRLNRGTWLLPVPANQTYPSEASEASNVIARAQGIERNPPGEAGFREPKLFYDIFEPEGVASWIRGVLLARARCHRELPAHARHRRVSTLRIGERTYGSDDGGLAWRQSTDGTTVELLGGLCERQIDRPTSWWVAIQ